jgi:hypothetical protein
MTQFYQRRSFKKTVTRRELPRADMTIEGTYNSAGEEESSDDNDVEDDTYIPSPRASTHGRGKGLASGSDSEAAKIQEGEDEIFDVEEINPPNYIHMGTPTFTNPQILDGGKRSAVRERQRW